MTPEHWQQVKALLKSAIQRDPDERAAFISKACGGDESLRHEVESLIISQRVGSCIANPVVVTPKGRLMKVNRGIESEWQSNDPPATAWWY